MERTYAPRHLGALIGILMAAAGLAQAGGPAPAPGSAPLIVRLADAAPDAAARFSAITGALGIEDVAFERRLDDSLLVARFTKPITAERRQQLVESLNAHPAVLRTENDGRVYPAYTPNDPAFTGGQQWSLSDYYGIRASAAWDRQRGSADLVVALLDTGILDHEDLNPARRLAGYDFLDRDSDASDPGDYVNAGDCGGGQPLTSSPSSWHGLHVAGVMTATTDNLLGIAGINHASPLLPVRVLGSCGGWVSDVIPAIRWAAGLPVSGVPANPHPARVINLSLVSELPCIAELQAAIDAAVAAGAVVVAAAGNGDGGDVANTMPGGCANVITVAATDRDGRLAGYSNLGSRVLLGAPGSDIYSTVNGGLTSPNGIDSYAAYTGTSVAAAQVSAAVSLLLSAQPTLTLGNVRQILSQTARPYSGGCPSALPCGAGILDLDAALRRATEITPGDPVPDSGGGGGGGGGGCSVAAGPGPADAAWGVVCGFLLWARRRAQFRRS
ncbi:MAG: S8 family serine peptidase [Gammaproteobacteria bacterium]